MARLVYRPAALADLDDVYEFISRDNLLRALSFVEEIQEQCVRLAALPGTPGKARLELQSGLRSFVIKGYVILFLYQADRFDVVDIIEGHRNSDGLFS